MSSWDEEPRLDERRASAPDVPKHNRKKNTRRWCKGKVGVEHQAEIVIDERTAVWRSNNHTRPECYRPDWLRNTKHGSTHPTWSWMCSHVERCVVCGKILEHFLGENCPVYTPEITVFKAEELAKLKRATKG